MARLREVQRPWSPDEDKTLRDWVACKFSNRVIAEKLGRSESSIRGRLASLARHGASPAKQPAATTWTPAHDARLRDLLAQGRTTKQLVEEMGFASSCIRNHKTQLGLQGRPGATGPHVMRPNGVPAKAAALLAEHGAMTLTRLSVLVGRSIKSLCHALGSAVSAGLICRDNDQAFAKRTYWVPGNPPREALPEVLPAGGDFHLAVRRTPGVVSEFPPLDAHTLSQMATLANLRSRQSRRV